MSGMFTSRRMTAKSSCNRCWSAASPELATTSVWPSCSNALHTAIVVRSSSSTMSTFAFGAAGCREESGDSSDGADCDMVPRSHLARCGTERYDVRTPGATRRPGLFRPLKPDPEYRHQLVHVDRLGDIVRSAGIDAFL